MNIFDPEIIRELFRNYYLLFVLGIFIGAFLVTYYLIPKVLWIIKEKKLYKPVIDRSVHSIETPTFGGVAFFTCFVLMISMLQSFHSLPTGNHLIAAVTLMFMVGLKDDLVVSSAKVKLIGQLLATAFIVFSPEMQITTLHGFLGIYEIPAALGYVIAAFLVVALINAYNLIDGINGLAGIIGIIVCSAYGIAFSLTGNAFFVMVCLVVIGILTAFLRFNFSNGRNKLFMGDSGSLIIGLILGFLTVKMLGVSANIPYLEPGTLPAHRVLFVLAVLFVPIFDTARVMILRLWKGKSPFEADCNHAHHVLLNLGLNHMQSSLFLGTLNIAIILIFAFLSGTMSTAWLTLSIVLIYGLVFLLFESAAKYLIPKTQKKTAIHRKQKTKPVHSRNVF